jgi:hypothetical protein
VLACTTTSYAQLDPEALILFSEISDAFEITALRAAQVLATYDAANGYPAKGAPAKARLADARSFIEVQHAIYIHIYKHI